MKTKNLSKKLVLNKKTIADLREFKNAYGGITETLQTKWNTCHTGICGPCTPTCPFTCKIPCSDYC